MGQLLASELYALSQGTRCEGRESCHWCSAPCNPTWPHDDRAIITPHHSFSNAKRPSCAYVCVACWLWRRRFVTVRFLSGDFRDRQDARNYSWFITNTGAWAVRRGDYGELYRQLLKPPYVFSLSLLDGAPENGLHLSVANDLPYIEADTPLKFTVNGILHTYTVYEMTEAVKSGDPSGTEPGVQALLRLLGTPPDGLIEPRVVEVKRKAGRPSTDPDKERPQKAIVRSGS